MNTIFEQVDTYIESLLAADDKDLKFARNNIASRSIPDASVSANQGKFLQVLAKACNAKKILELGTLGAYSTIWLARALPPGGKVITIEFDPFHVKIAGENLAKSGLQHQVDIRQGAALDILPELEKERAGPFDMVFIDADKPPYVEYFQWAIRLGRPGTIIVADNVIRNGKVLDKNSNDEKVNGVQRLNEWLSSCKDVTATIIQTVGAKEHDGMVVAVVN